MKRRLGMILIAIVLATMFVAPATSGALASTGHHKVAPTVLMAHPGHRTQSDTNDCTNHTGNPCEERTAYRASDHHPGDAATLKVWRPVLDNFDGNLEYTGEVRITALPNAVDQMYAIVRIWRQGPCVAIGAHAWDCNSASKINVTGTNGKTFDDGSCDARGDSSEGCAWLDGKFKYDVVDTPGRCFRFTTTGDGKWMPTSGSDQHWYAFDPTLESMWVMGEGCI